MTGYGPLLFGNRLVRTRMPGGVEAGGEKPPAIRLYHAFVGKYYLSCLSEAKRSVV
jgi:hypothetical protein